MSGSTIGGVVGGVIGWFVGGPVGAQWGFMIGSAVGAIVDPQQFEGPRLGEAKTQTANDGVPLIYGYGTFPCAGNLTWVDTVKEHKKTETAKGGPETTTYTYTVSYMIVVCKGEISGYKIIKRNGKIVYDARTDAELSALGYSANEISETRAAQASFLQRATLYYGTQTQMPDPTMVAVKGAGEVPAYTGIAYIVMKDDETREGEVSQYEFVVAACGERTEDESLPSFLMAAGSSTVGDPLFSESDAKTGPDFSGIPLDTGADIGDGIPEFYNGVWVVASSSAVRRSTDQRQTWQSGTIALSGTANSTLLCLAGGPDGFAAVGRDFPNFYAFSGPDGLEFVNTTIQVDNGSGPTALSNAAFFRYTGGKWWVAGGQTGFSAGCLYSAPTLDAAVWQLSGAFSRTTYNYDYMEWGGYRWLTCRDDAYLEQGNYTLQRAPVGTEDWEVVIESDNTLRPWQIEAGDDCLVVLAYGGNRLWTSADDFATARDTGIRTATTATIVQSEQIGRLVRYASGRFFIMSGAYSFDTSKQNRCVATADGITFTAPVPLGINVAGKGLAASRTEYADGLTPIPDSPGYYIDSDTGQIIGPDGTQIDPCTPTLGSIVADQCERRGVTSRDVSELTDDVGGYRVAAPSTPQRNIQGLQPGYFFGASEFDGTLHFPKRGRPLTFSLTQDDFVDRDGDPIQWERTQETELLRKVTVGYVDPATTYTATTQQAERRATKISAEGESTIEVAVTGSKDWAAQVADKSIKVAWGEPDECTFHVTIDYAELVTGAEGTVPYLDGSSTEIRIERIEDEGLVRMITGRRTRKNLYESNASGAAKPLPLFPGSNIRGPTDGLLLNLPVIVDSNDVPGIAWAASGSLSGWAGTALQFQRSGQWVDAGTVTLPATMGTLLADLPAHAGDLDNTNVLHLRMNSDLESVTFTNLLQERNPLAILYPDGTAEIVQFQTATEVAAGEYELTTLIRGRLNTVRGDHASGARVVFLDNSVQYASLQPTDVGTTLTYRFVSLGTDPDAAPVLTMDLDTMESQTEWPVDSLAVDQDGDDFILTWLARDRLGTDVFPIRSTNWRGYQVSWSYGGNSHTETVLTETVTFTLPGATDVTFSVAQLNLFTGAGPAQTVTVP